MNAMIKGYLDELYIHLSPLPEPERIDAVREIESHIAEGQTSGKPMADILAGLGQPRALAEALLERPADEGPAHPSPQPVVQQVAQLATSSGGGTGLLIAYLVGAGFASLVVVPTLGALIIGFGAATVAAPIAIIAVLAGVPRMYVSAGSQPPDAVVIPILLVLASVFAFITWGCTKGLVAYCRAVVAGFRRLESGRAARVEVARTISR